MILKNYILTFYLINIGLKKKKNLINTLGLLRCIIMLMIKTSIGNLLLFSLNELKPLRKKKKIKKKRTRLRSIFWAKTNINQSWRYIRLKKKAELNWSLESAFNANLLSYKQIILTKIYIPKFKALFFSNILANNLNCLIEYHFILKNYFYTIFNYKFILKLINLSNFFQVPLLNYSIKKLKKLTPKRLKLYYFTELTEILFSSFLAKNLNLLVLWFKRLVEKNSFKNFHLCRKYFIKLFYFFWRLRTFLVIKGFFLKFKGKFSKGGVKKRHIIVQKGEFSGTSKNLRLIIKQAYLRTMTGVMGFKLKISY